MAELDPVTRQLLDILNPSSTPAATEKETAMTEPTALVPASELTREQAERLAATIQLKSFATDLLALVTAAEAPMSHRVTDPDFRAEALKAIAAVRGFRDELLEAFRPFLEWDDVSEDLLDEASESDEVVDAVLNSVKWDRVKKFFDSEMEDEVAAVIDDSSFEDLLDRCGSRRHFIEQAAESVDLREHVLDTLSEEDFEELAARDSIRGQVLRTIGPDDLSVSEIERLADFACIRERVIATSKPIDAERVKEATDAVARAEAALRDARLFLRELTDGVEAGS